MSGARSITFITRKFPPARGGMETLSESVWRSLQEVDERVDLIAHRGRKLALLTWVPSALLLLATRIARRRTRAVLVGDAFLFAIASPLLRATRVRHATMVMGLDVTFRNPIYRMVVHRALRRAPHVVAISQATAQSVIDAGAPAARVSVVRLGVAPPPSVEDGHLRRELRSRFGVPTDTPVLLTVGRLIRRKGVRWFVEQVLPGIPEPVVYIVAGVGPEHTRIRDAARRAGVEDRLLMVGAVDDDAREALYRAADLFVQPNIAVKGDLEGFGLVVVEAAVRGLPAMASAVDGLVDAVVNGETGILLRSGDADAWTAEIAKLLADPEALRAMGSRFQVRARELYSEKQMGRELHSLLFSAER